MIPFVSIHKLHRMMLFIRLMIVYLQNIKNVQNPNLLPITIPLGMKQEELAEFARLN